MAWVASIASIATFGGSAQRLTAQQPSVARAAAVAPAGITVSGAAGAITVAWTALAGVARYEVMRSTIAAAPSSDLGGSVAMAAFVDNSALPGTTYHYQVVAIYADGRKSASAPVAYTVPQPAKAAGTNATTFATAVVTPTTPSNFRGRQTGDGTVELRWDAAPGVAYYTVLGPGLPERGTQVTPPATSLVISRAPPGVDSWRIGASFDPGNVSTPTSAFSTTTVTVKPTKTGEHPL